ncbi:hypothetical protein RclHR1_02710002 [Rhizophagus clarus]|uniref:Uncharacterized protein n=1 Tax=Rhizophagus clarus TaxID=94130 RepID=A0A2Z6R1K1_9GLOM|nr:hypothetical protein RclHR1_02710002 [Rhizophagus clarus]
MPNLFLLGYFKNYVDNRGTDNAMSSCTSKQKNFHKQNFENQASVYKVSEVNGLHESSHAHNSSSMLIEKIKNECDRLHITTSVMLNLSRKGSELTELELTDSEFTQYLEGIKEFGFNHIIIVENKPRRVAWAVELNRTVTQLEVDKNLFIVHN